MENFQKKYVTTITIHFIILFQQKQQKLKKCNRGKTSKNLNKSRNNKEKNGSNT